jgi:creatinine amidohydrolase
LGTDQLTARELGRRVAERLPVVVAPVVGFGFYPAFTAYPGSQHLKAETFIALVRELIENLVDHGVTRIVVVNTGVSTEAPLRIVAGDILARRGVRIAVVDMRLLGRATDSLMRQQGGGHADERETSVMLAIRPDAVRMDLARRAEDAPEAPSPAGFARSTRLGPEPAPGMLHSPTGATGDPTLATREKGERVLDEMTRELVDGIRALFPDAVR